MEDLSSKIDKSLVNYHHLVSGESSPFEDDDKLGILANLYFSRGAELYVDETKTLLFGKTKDLNKDLIKSLDKSKADLKKETIQLIEKIIGTEYDTRSDGSNLILIGKTNSVIYLRQNN